MPIEVRNQIVVGCRGWLEKRTLGTSQSFLSYLGGGYTSVQTVVETLSTELVRSVHLLRVKYVAIRQQESQGKKETGMQTITGLFASLAVGVPEDSQGSAPASTELLAEAQQGPQHPSESAH